MFLIHQEAVIILKLFFLYYYKSMYLTLNMYFRLKYYFIKSDTLANDCIHSFTWESSNKNEPAQWVCLLYLVKEHWALNENIHKDYVDVIKVYSKLESKTITRVFFTILFWSWTLNVHCFPFLWCMKLCSGLRCGVEQYNYTYLKVSICY